jgi:hypothetical protein
MLKLGGTPCICVIQMLTLYSTFTKFTNACLLIEDVTPNKELNPFELNNLEEYCHLPIVSLQKSIVVNPEEFLPCLESLLSHLQFDLLIQHRE